MSRRREPRRESLVAQHFSTVKVICSGRGRHEVVSFGSVDVFPTGGSDGAASIRPNLRAGKHLYVEDPDWTNPAEALAAIGRTHQTFTLRCPRCRPVRTVPLTHDRMLVLFLGLVDAGLPRLDISAIDSIGAID